MINKNNIGSINDNNNNYNIVTTLIILTTINRKVKLKLTNSD